MSLKSRVIKGSIWSLIGGSGQQLISFFIFLYLAKILDARSVGIVASAAIFSDLIIIVSRMGIMESIQRTDENHAVEESTFFFTILTGFIGSLSIISLAFILRYFEISSNISNIMLILSPMAMFSAAGAVPEGIIRRRLDFRSLTFRTWASTLFSGLVAVIMLRQGFGFYALAAQRVAASSSGFILIWMQADWRPNSRRSLRTGWPVVRSGSMILVGNFSGIVNARISDSITALFLGPAALGFLRVSSRFSDVMVQMTVTPVAGVALPSFSALKSDRAALGRMYLRLSQFMAAGAIPLFFGLGSVAKPFISLVLGDKWLGAVIAFQLMGFLITAGTINYFFSPLMVALGRADIVMKQSFIQVFLGAGLIWVGSNYGLIGVLVAGIIRAVLVSLMNLYIICRSLELKAWKIISMIFPPFAASLVMYYTVSNMERVTSHLSNLSTLAIMVICGALTYFTVMMLGDYVGLWKNYIRGAYSAVRNRS